MRWLLGAVGALAGVVVGAVVMLSVQGTGAQPPPAPPAPAVEVATPAADEAQADGVLLAWTPGGLPAGLARRVRRLPQVDAVTVVHGGLVELAASTDARGRTVDDLEPGFVVPLDAIAVDPQTYAAFLPTSARPQFATMERGFALLGATSARLRKLGAGATLTLADGTALTVAGVVDDSLVAAGEVAVARGTLDGLRPRYLLIRHRGERAAVEDAVRAAAAGRVPVRVRAPGETPFLRHGDAVLPPAIVKEQFGEFSYRRGAGRDVTQGGGWAREHIRTATVPLLGRVTCHRAIIPKLRGALSQLADEGLGGLVRRGGYAGCYNPRLTSSLDSVSRHAWGIALDLNQDRNPYGSAGRQDRRLVRILQRWGFTWGGHWLIPDPAHFEYVAQP